MSICACGRTTSNGQTQCKKCWAKRMRQNDLQPRLEVIKQYKVTGKVGEWADEFDVWIELQQCHARELTTYLRSRSGKRKVWPDTEHSLSCWIKSNKDAAHICDCGALVRSP